ncbi:MAG TPA: hypothetical protein VFG14_20430 [Chthoniobacteraceae bacterium]|nr:hypothetical protein [Chthoniobacteraceae bacterium]
MTDAGKLVKPATVEAIAAYIRESAQEAFAAKVKAFNHYPGQTFTSSNWMERNSELRAYLSDAWRSADRNQREEFVSWYIKKWGGIKRLGVQHVVAYAAGPASIDMTDFTRIASWSKALAMMDPHQFAIYDARVAFALNAVQAIKLGWIPTWFRIPTTQKGVVKGTHIDLERYASPSTIVLGDADVYRAYLYALQKCATSGMEQSEMILFALTDSLAAGIRKMPTIPRPQLSSSRR